MLQESPPLLAGKGSQPLPPGQVWRWRAHAVANHALQHQAEQLLLTFDVPVERRTFDIQLGGYFACGERRQTVSIDHLPRSRDDTIDIQVVAVLPRATGFLGTGPRHSGL